MKGEIKQFDLMENDYATKIMEIANKQGLDVANKVNHDAFYKGLVDYEHFRASAELLATFLEGTNAIIVGKPITSEGMKNCRLGSASPILRRASISHNVTIVER